MLNSEQRWKNIKLILDDVMPDLTEEKPQPKKAVSKPTKKAKSTPTKKQVIKVAKV